MASAIDTIQDNAQGDLTSQAGPSPPAESSATPRTLSRINTDLSSSRSQDERSSHGGDNDAALHSALSTASSVTSPPPYWPHASLHQRNISNLSTESFLPAEAIRLRDNDTNDDDRNSACWAKSVEITDYIFINGSNNTNIGAFIVWNISVETMNGSYMNIRKRYSEFDDFRRKLTQSFPNFRAAVPELPPKSTLFKFRPKFLEKRRAGLQYFLNCILLNPEFSGSPVLKDFLFA
ncbi:Phox homologous domain-containing protein [Trichoderma austrokoningii]